MAMDSVIEALLAAVAAAPDDRELRAHLAQVLLEDARYDAALAEATTLLADRPDDVRALRVAGAAARGGGDEDRGAAYLRMADALDPGQGSAGAEPAPAPALDSTEGPARDTRENTPTSSAADAARAYAVPDTAEEMLEGWADSDAPAEPVIGEITQAGITLADVGGLADVKSRLRSSFLTPMHNPQLRAQFGKSLRGGLLLWGPPGCGKTFIARALAGELGASFYEIGLADVLDMWIGASERNLRAIFEAARRNRPCLVFFDEIDALGQKRSQLRNATAMRGVVNQLLAELDGASSDNEGVFVLAASNHPWDVDSALLRPGRFDRTVLVLPPDQEARVSILAYHLRGKPTDRLDLAKVAKATDGYSGADLALVCEQATEAAMAESMDSGIVRPITQQQVVAAVRSVRPSIGEWLETAKNYALYANQSGAYDELAAYLRRRRRA